MQQDGRQVLAANRWGKTQQAWPVAPYYEIDPSGLLVENDQASTDWERAPRGYYQHYDPLAVHGLPGELAALFEDDQVAVMQFAQLRGLLGYGCLEGPMQEPQEPEPLSWIWAHAETVRRVLKLIRLLRDRDKQLGEYLASIAEQAPLAGSEFESKWREDYALAFPSDRVTNVFFRHAQGRNPAQYAHPYIPGAARSITTLDLQVQRRIAWYVVRRSINANLETVVPQLIQTDDAEPLHAYQYPALTTAVYIHLYDVALGRTDFGECKRCGRFFLLPLERSGPKPQYCPRTDNTRGESLCSLRTRKDKWRTKPKGGSHG